MATAAAPPPSSSMPRTGARTWTAPNTRDRGAFCAAARPGSSPGTSRGAGDRGGGWRRL